MSGVIYCITNTLTGKRYVGQTIGQLSKRWREHKFNARRGDDTVLYKALRKYGEAGFTIEAIDRAETVERLNELEEHHIAVLSTLVPGGYNLTRGGNNRAYLPETCAKISASKMGNQAWKGRKHTDEAKRKISEANRGHGFTTEQLAKIGAASKGRVKSEEERAKLSAANTGRQHTDETREKISQARLGMVFSDEHRLNISKANKGRIKSPEARAKQSASLKEWWRRRRELG